MRLFRPRLPDLSRRGESFMLRHFGVVVGLLVLSGSTNAWAQDGTGAPPAGEGGEAAGAANAEAGATLGAPAGGDKKIKLGLRLGYGLPLGDAAKDAPLSDTFSGQIPIWIDAGYM